MNSPCNVASISRWRFQWKIKFLCTRTSNNGIKSNKRRLFTEVLKTLKWTRSILVKVWLRDIWIEPESTRKTSIYLVPLSSSKKRNIEMWTNCAKKEKEEKTSSTFRRHSTSWFFKYSRMAFVPLATVAGRGSLNGFPERRKSNSKKTTKQRSRTTCNVQRFEQRTFAQLGRQSLNVIISDVERD